jgi:hypothetical protein
VYSGGNSLTSLRTCNVGTGAHPKGEGSCWGVGDLNSVYTIVSKVLHCLFISRNQPLIYIDDYLTESLKTRIKYEVSDAFKRQQD